MITNIYLGYSTAALDFEGYITITAPTNSNQGALHVGVTNTNRGVLEELERVWGGIIHTHGKVISENHKQGYVWRLNGKEGIPYLTAILPHLRIKRRQAELALEFAQTIKGGPPALTEETLIHRETLRNELTELNRRGSCLQ
jgi:hypothetical protein